MAVKIRLKRMGKIRTPFYRVVIADSRTKRDGRVIEEIGTYNPKADPSIIHIDSERAQHWLSVGAQPSDAVAALMRVTGDLQKFKGDPAPAPMMVAEPKRDKAEIFNEALKEIHGESGAPSSAPSTRGSRTKAADKPAEKSADEAADKPAEKSAAKAADKPAHKAAETLSADDATATTES